MLYGLRSYVNRFIGEGDKSKENIYAAVKGMIVQCTYLINIGGKYVFVSRFVWQTRKNMYGTHSSSIAGQMKMKKKAKHTYK